MEPRLVPLGHESEAGAGFALPAVLGRGAATGVHDVRCSRRQCTVDVVDANARTAGVVVAGVNASLLVCARTGARQSVSRTQGRVPMAPGDVLELIPGVQPAFRLVWPLPSSPPSLPPSNGDDDIVTHHHQDEEEEAQKEKEEEEEEKMDDAAVVVPFRTEIPPATTAPAPVPAPATTEQPQCELWMPLLGTGVLGMDVGTAATIMLTAVREAGTMEGGARIVLAVDDDAAHRAVCALLEPDTLPHLVVTRASVPEHVAACLRGEDSSSSGTHVYHALECSWRWTLVAAPGLAREPCGNDETVGERVRAEAARAGPGRLAEVRALTLPAPRAGFPAIPLLLCVAPNAGNAAKADHIADPAVARAALAQTCRNLLAVFRRIAAATAAGATVVLSPLP